MSVTRTTTVDQTIPAGAIDSTVPAGAIDSTVPAGAKDNIGEMVPATDRTDLLEAQKTAAAALAAATATSLAEAEAKSSTGTKKSPKKVPAASSRAGSPSKKAATVSSRVGSPSKKAGTVSTRSSPSKKALAAAATAAATAAAAAAVSGGVGDAIDLTSNASNNNAEVQAAAVVTTTSNMDTGDDDEVRDITDEVAVVVADHSAADTHGMAIGDPTDKVVCWTAAGARVDATVSEFNTKLKGLGHLLHRPPPPSPNANRASEASTKLPPTGKSLGESVNQLMRPRFQSMVRTTKSDEEGALEDAPKIIEWLRTHPADERKLEETRFIPTVFECSFDYDFSYEPSTTMLIWQDYRRFASGLHPVKDITRPGRMFLDRDINRTPTMPAAELKRLSGYVIEKHALRYQSMHMGFAAEQMVQSDYFRDNTPYIPFRWVPASGDGNCVFHSALMATRFESFMQEGRQARTGRNISEKQRRDEFAAMVELRGKEHAITTAILSGKGELQDVLNLIRSQTAPSEPQAFAETVHSLRMVCRSTRHDGWADASAVALAAPMERTSIMSWAPDTDDRAAGLVPDTLGEFASGILTPGHGKPHFWCDEEARKEGWMYNRPHKNFRHGHVVEVPAHNEMIAEAPDMLLFLYSPSLPDGWQHGIMHPLEYDVLNTIFLQPFAVFNASEKSIDYVKTLPAANTAAANQSKNTLPLRHHIVPGDTVVIPHPDPSKAGEVARAVVTMITLSRLTTDGARAHASRAFGGAIDSEGNKIIEQTKSGVEVPGFEGLDEAQIKKVMEDAKERAHNSVVSVLILAVPCAFVTGSRVIPDRGDIASNVVIGIDPSDILQVSTTLTPPHAEARLVLTSGIKGDIDGHMVQYLEKFRDRARSDGNTSTFFSTGSRVATMNSILHAVAPTKTSFNELDEPERAKVLSRATHAMSVEGYDIVNYRQFRRLLQSKRYELWRPSRFHQKLAIFEHGCYQKCSTFIQFTPAQMGKILTIYGHGPYTVDPAAAAATGVSMADAEKDVSIMRENDWREFVYHGRDNTMPRAHSTLVEALTTKTLIDWSKMTEQERNLARSKDVNPFRYFPMKDDAAFVADAEEIAFTVSSPKSVGRDAVSRESSAAAKQTRVDSAELKRVAAANRDVNNIISSDAVATTTAATAAAKSLADEQAAAATAKSAAAKSVADEQAAAATAKSAAAKSLADEQAAATAAAAKSNVVQQVAATTADDDDNIEQIDPVASPTVVAAATELAALAACTPVKAKATERKRSQDAEKEKFAKALLNLSKSKKSDDKEIFAAADDLKNKTVHCEYYGIIAFNLTKEIMNRSNPELKHMEPISYVGYTPEVTGLYYGTPHLVYAGLVDLLPNVFGPFLNRMCTCEVAGTGTRVPNEIYAMKLMNKGSPALYSVRYCARIRLCVCVCVCVCVPPR
jgi:hypothetical protein